MPELAPARFAVIFTSQLRPGQEGYQAMADKMARMVKEQPGFLGFDSARGGDGLGITVSYWSSLEAIRRWKAVGDHREAQELGRSNWYSGYRLQVAQVIEERSFDGI